MHLTYEDLILDFIDCSDIFDHMVLRPLSHIRGNWELQWNYEKLEFLEEEDSFAKDLNQLLRDIADYELPCNYRYHASEDIIARLVKKHLHWNIYRDRRGFWHGAEYIWIIEQGTLYDIDQQEILKALKGRILAAIVRKQKFSDIDSGHQAMIAGLFSIILYVRGMGA